MISRGILARLIWAALFVALSGIPSVSDASSSTSLLEKTAQLIDEEKFGAAIREAEAAADSDVVDADLSFNRGLAYLRRGQTTTAEPGDLAQAAAGFAEALQLRPNDAEAERGLEQARIVIAQDRSQKGTSPEASNLGILERVLLALPPLALAIVAGLGSLALCVGLILLASRHATRKTTGAITTLVGSLMMLPCLLVFGLRQTLFDGSTVAVVIADSAEVVDESGKRIAGRAAYRKGTLLHLGPKQGGLAPLVGITSAGFVPIERLRFLESDR